MINIKNCPRSARKKFVQCTVHSHGIQLMRLMGLIGIREIKRLTDERLIEERRIVEGDGAGLILIEKIEEGNSPRISFSRRKKEKAHGNSRILSTVSSPLYFIISWIYVYSKGCENWFDFCEFCQREYLNKCFYF